MRLSSNTVLVLPFLSLVFGYINPRDLTNQQKVAALGIVRHNAQEHKAAAYSDMTAANTNPQKYAQDMARWNQHKETDRKIGQLGIDPRSLEHLEHLLNRRDLTNQQKVAALGVVRYNAQEHKAAAHADMTATDTNPQKFQQDMARWREHRETDQKIGKLGIDPRSVYKREAYPSPYVTMYERDAEPEFDDYLGVYERDAEPEFDDYFGVYERDAEPEFDGYFGVYERDAEPEFDGYFGVYERDVDMYD